MQRSLRHRLAWAMSLLTMTVIVVLAVALSLAAEEREEELIDEIVNTALNGQITHAASNQAEVLPHHLRFFRAPIGQLPDQLPPEILHFPIGNSEWDDGDTEYHVGVREVGKERWYMLYDTERHERHMRNLHIRLSLAVLLLSALAWILGRFLAGNLLSQLTRLATAVQQDQAPELTSEMDQEVAVLAQAIAQYREEKQQHLQREREFSAHVSHEIRTPLTRIRTSAELLAETAQLPPQHQLRCQKIMGAVDDLENKLRALLFLARDINPASAREIPLAAALNAAVERLPEQHAELVWNNQVPGDYSVISDPTLLDLLLDNLLSNAWRYTQAGSVSTRIIGDELEIADTGCGIDSELLPHIFTPYQRGSDIAGGQGLGLAIVARICSVYGWTCRIENAAIGTPGSRVYLKLH